MAPLLLPPAGGGGGGVPQQRLPVYAWLLLWALVVSIGSMFRQNLTSFYNDVAVPLPAAGIVVGGGDRAHNHTTTTNVDPHQVDPRRRADQQTPLVVDDHASSSSSASQQQETTTTPEAESSSSTRNDAGTAGGTTTTPPPLAPQKPLNIVLLYADDWSYSSLGVAGNSYVQTPRLDAMAKAGIYFTHNCVTSSICMQSRATLYTGQYASKHQTFFAYRNVTMYDEGRWNQTLYPLMKKAGYHIGFFGKYHHLEPPPRHIPTFDEFITTPFSHFFQRNGVEKHITEWNEEDGLNYLRNKPADQPFFLTVSFFATHAEDGSVAQYRPQESSMHLYQEADVPLPKTYTEEHWKQLPPFFNQYNFGRARFMHRYKTHDMYQHHMKNTYRMVTEVDAACGRIMDYLNATNQMDNTMIIFTTDNGNLHGQHGLAEKWYAYQESIRVPLIIHDPRQSHQPAVISDFSLNVDLAPTILSAAGVDVPATMQGEDLADLYLRGKPGRKEFWYEFWDDNDGIPSSVALVQKDFKYIYWTDHNYHQAFNLTADPLEEHDLASTISPDEYAKVKRRMVELQTYVRQDSGPRVFPASLQAIQ